MLFGKRKTIKDLQAKVTELEALLKTTEETNALRGHLLQSFGLNITGLEGEMGVSTLQSELDDGFSVFGRSLRDHVLITTDFSKSIMSESAIEWFQKLFPTLLTAKAVEKHQNRQAQQDSVDLAASE
jgi:hypothetical protein